VLARPTPRCYNLGRTKPVRTNNEVRDVKQTFEDLEAQVLQWAEERGILAEANPQAQLLKTLEELGETAGALAKGKHDQLMDGIGDVVVTLILFASMKGFDITTALEQAYGEIADRKGYMRDGIFVKDDE